MVSEFWTEVIEAHNQVAVQHERRISVARDKKSALIYYDTETSEVVIAVSPAMTETVEPLIGGD